MSNLQNPWWWAGAFLAGLVALLLALGAIAFILISAPILHMARTWPTAIARAEYQRRQRTRNWDGYE